MNLKSTKRFGTLPQLTGAASILDLHGSTHWFRELSPCRHYPASLGFQHDFFAVGKHLEQALLDYVEHLPQDKYLQLHQALTTSRHALTECDSVWRAEEAEPGSNLELAKLLAAFATPKARNETAHDREDTADESR